MVITSPWERNLLRDFTSKASRNELRSYIIRINEQWRICFTFVDGHADAVEIVDYH
ncbi:MAG: hypothetical protein WAO71_15355 [Gallionella sp.]